MLITISLLILAYLIMGKDIKPLLERVKNINWRGKINALMDKLRPWALKAGRVATRPAFKAQGRNLSINALILPRQLMFFTRSKSGLISLPIIR